MKSSEKIFRVLDAFDAEEISTQRQLADLARLSVGHVNHILKSLMENGLVRIESLLKNGPKAGNTYLLTRKGIQAKSRLAVGFLTRKLEEYDDLKDRLAQKLSAIEKKGGSRVVFVGPEIIRDFAGSVIRERDLNIGFSGQCKDWTGLKELPSESFDMVLLFDDSAERIQKIEESTGISRERLLSVW